MLSHPWVALKKKIITWIRFALLYRTSRNFVVRLTSLRDNDVKFKKCAMPTLFCVVMNATFTMKHSESKGMEDMSVRCG